MRESVHEREREKGKRERTRASERRASETQRQSHSKSRGKETLKGIGEKVARLGEFGREEPLTALRVAIRFN